MRSVVQQLIHGFLSVMKTGLLNTFEGLRQINKASYCRHGKYAEGARDPKPLAPGDKGAFPIVHQDQVGVEFDSESDHVFLARVEFVKRSSPRNSVLPNFRP